MKILLWKGKKILVHMKMGSNTRTMNITMKEKELNKNKKIFKDKIRFMKMKRMMSSMINSTKINRTMMNMSKNSNSMNNQQNYKDSNKQSNNNKPYSNSRSNLIHNKILNSYKPNNNINNYKNRIKLRAPQKYYLQARHQNKLCKVCLIAKIMDWKHLFSRDHKEKNKKVKIIVMNK